MVMVSAMRGELLLQRSLRLLGVSDISRLQCSTDLLEDVRNRALGRGRILAQLGKCLLGAGEIAGIDRFEKLRKLLLKRVLRVGLHTVRGG